MYNRCASSKIQWYKNHFSTQTSRNYDDREEKSFLERNSTLQNQKIYKENLLFSNYTKNVVNETWLLLRLVECVQPQTQCSQYGNCRLNEPELCSVLVYTNGMRGQRQRVRVAIGLGVGGVRMRAKEFGNMIYSTTIIHDHCVRRNRLPHHYHDVDAARPPYIIAFVDDSYFSKIRRVRL